ncbi:MAG: homoserine kinase [Candidatus Bathyarchaeia archaeon]
MKKGNERVKVIAPSTIANLGPGFDVFGLAVNAFYDEVVVEISSNPSIEIFLDGIDSSIIPKDPSKNTAGLVAMNLLDKIKSQLGLKIFIKKGIPVGKGLGSSAACAVACALALNKLFKLNLSKDELIAIAAEGEKASAGVPHADNVAAATLGGFVILSSYNPLNVIKIDPPKQLGIVIAIPEIPFIPKKTSVARSILPKLIPLKKLVHNTGYACTIVAGFATSNMELIGKGMKDEIIEPVRSRLIPGYSRVKEEALKAGAIGVAISGAGPTMIAIIDKRKSKFNKVFKAMKDAFKESGVDSKVYLSEPSDGAHIIGH